MKRLQLSFLLRNCTVLFSAMTMEYCLSDRYQADFTDHNGGHKADNGLAQK